MVRAEQMCHPISDCSSILFSPPFLCSLCHLLILALSPELMSDSHPYSPILTLNVPSILTFLQPPRLAPLVLISLFFSFLSFSVSFSPFFTHSFISCLTYFLFLSHFVCVCGRGAVMEQDEFLIACRQHGALSLVRISQRRGKGCRKKDAIFHWLYMTIIAPLPNSPPLLFLTAKQQQAII